MKTLKLMVKAVALTLIVSIILGVESPVQAASPGDVVINEIMQNPSAVLDGSGEWFEVFNATGSGIDIDGWTIADNDFDSHVINNGGPLVIPAGGYLVLSNNSDSGSNGGLTVNYQYSGIALANGADELVLSDTASTEIDRVEWDGGPAFPDPTGAAMALKDTTLDNNVGDNWCTASTAYGDGDFGTPGAANDCSTGGGGGDTANPGDIVINEIIQNPSAVADGSGEWFEVFNATGSGIDINGWTIADNDFDSHVINNGGPLNVPAGGFLVLGNNSDSGSNGGLTVNYQYSGIALANGADELVLFDSANTEIDRVEWDGGPAFPDPTGASMALKDTTLDNNVGDNWCTASTPYGSGDFGTPGAANDCPGDPEPPQSVKIHEVQGNGAASPLVGAVVIIEGIVVGDFQDGASGTNGDLNGFHVQEEDADVDGDPLTSEGIFVFDGSSPAVNVAIGDLVRVEGEVSEFNGLTEITSFTGVTVLSSGNPLPTAATPTLPLNAVDDFEAYEGMLVTFAQSLVISEYFNFDRFNETVLTSQRHFQPTASFEPGSQDVIDAMQAFLLDRITLDDGRTSQNPDPAIHPNGVAFDLTNLFRGGDTVADVTGIMDFAFGLYRIQPTQGAIYTSVNPRPAQPDDVGGTLEVASFNVLNYFTTLDNSGSICGPAGDQGCRGADDANELTRQRDKILDALAIINADVVGLIEIENHPGDVPTADLVSGLNDELGAGTYSYIATGAIGTDAIRVAFIYKPASVTPVGAYAILDESVDSRFLDDFNRPVLAQSFQDNTTGGIFTVAVNHLKSKGSDCNDIGDPDTGDGSGNCNLTRKAAAEALVDWLATDPTGSGDGDFLIIGDLNSYDKEDPIDVIKEGPDDSPGTSDDYTDLILHFQGEDAYSFVFDGQLGYLDHALANTDMFDETTGVTEWHINADEADLIDYDTSFKQPAQDAIYAPDAYRSSDHDPVVVGLDVCDEIAPTLEVTVSPDSLWPPNHKMVSVTATVTAADNFDQNPTVTLVSVTSNEPDDGQGDGDTANDIEIVDDFNFNLRAERSGGGDGRIYTITYQVTDACGNVTEASATVTVPQSNGNN